MRSRRPYHRYLAAGLAALVSVCVAWPASASTADITRGAIPVRTATPPAAASALLITGDRDGPLIQLSLAGQRYVIPTDAIPYLGGGLSMSLFDVNAVARAERGGVLPVRIAYTGRVPSLPGVTITRASAGVASGYLDRVSAGRFGAALAKLAASDRARGRYGTDGMFAGGVRIGLAGAGASPAGRALRPAYPMRTLTVHGIDAAGQPDTGDGVIVMNVDNPTAFGDGEDALNVFYHGVVKFSVPAGTYWAVGFSADALVVSGAAVVSASGANEADWVDVLPQFTVSGNTSVTVDARKATSEVRFATPLPATLEQAQVNVERISRDGQAFEVSVMPGAPELDVNPVSRPPADGTLQSSTGAQLFSPASAASPYQYLVAVLARRGIIPPQDFRISAASLATVHENLYADAPSTGSFTDFLYLPSQQSNLLSTEVLPELSVPGRETVYLSTLGGSAVWQGIYTQVYSTISGGQYGPQVTYRPGQVATEDWNAYPLHTAPNVDLVGAAGGGYIVSANRSGNALTLDLMPFSDSSEGDLGTGFVPTGGATIAGTYQIRQNGKVIAHGNALNSQGIPTGAFYQQVTLSPKPSVISFTLTADRTGAAYTLSTATSTTWTWHSAHESGGTVPGYWYCSLAGNHNCAAQPLPMLSYAVGRLALNGRAPAGDQTLTVNVGHLQLAAAHRVTKVTVQASFNDGKTWTDAAVTGTGDTYHARFTAPAGGYVTLRVTAATAAGAQVSETITRAYAIAS